MKSNNSSIQETTAPVSVYITYSVIVPILCIIGIVGNSLSIIILSRKSLKKSIIYAYLKGLAVVDIAYLFFVSFECYFVLHGTLWHESPAIPIANLFNEWKSNRDILLVDSSKKLQESNPFHYYPIYSYPWNTRYGHTSTSRQAEYFEFNILPSLTSAFGTTSDIVIVFMTLNRFELVQEIGQMRAITHKHWISYIEVVCALAFSFLCHIPYFFRYQILPCDEIRNHFIKKPSLASNDTCFGHTNSRVTDDVFWIVFSFLIQFVLRLLPTVLICSLNSWMYFKLKSVQRHRDKLFGVPRKEQSLTSHQILDKSISDPTLSRTFKERLTNIVSKKNHEDVPIRSVSEIVMKTTSCLAVTANIPLQYHLKSTEIVCKNPDQTNKISTKSTILKVNSQTLAHVSDFIDYIGERSPRLNAKKKSYNVSQKFKDLLDVPDIIQSNQQCSLDRRKTLARVPTSGRGSISGGSHNRRELQRSIKILMMIVISHIVLSTPGNILYILATYDLDLIHYEEIEDKGWATFVTALFNLSHVFYISNYAINYFLYCLANEEIRKETINIYQQCKKNIITHCKK